MLLFNQARKYISLVTSLYFNTSNVTIQLAALISFLTNLTYFNTSNVTIQPRSKIIL